MKRFLSSGLFLSLLVTLPAFTTLPADEACNMSSVKKGFACEDCDLLLLPKEVVSNATFYECEECEVRQAKAGKCDYCDEDFAKKQSDKDACPECWYKADAAEICIKSCYECPDCGEQTAKSGKCADCKVKLKKTEVRARIEYECSGCGVSSETARDCDDEDCKAFGIPFEKVCSESGSFPHGS